MERIYLDYASTTPCDPEIMRAMEPYFFEKFGNVTVTTDNRDAVQNSDILIFAVQPLHVGKLLEEVKDLLTENHVIA